MDSEANHFFSLASRVSVMYTQEMFLEELNSLGFHGLFDFLHLPMYAETARSKGLQGLHTV